VSHHRLVAAAALALGLVAPIAASAQQAPPPAPAAGHHHRNAFRDALRQLNLSQSQRSQIDQAFAQARGQNKGVDKATRRANREHLHQQVEAVLTPAQRTQLHDIMRRDRRAPASR
jgi:Spy/CpxP family protein refolding chaperone